MGKREANDCYALVYVSMLRPVFCAPVFLISICWLETVN